MLITFSVKSQTLVWSDEFNGTSLNTSNWTHETGGHGWGNNELQYYRPENATISGGFLTITGKRETFGGRNYTSSRIKTQGKRNWTYGKMEARLQIPVGQGFWPAFWMLGENIGSVGWPACGEIDIMEHVNTGNAIVGTIHYNGPNGYLNVGNSFNTTPANFHTYTVDWSSSALRWYCDGVQYHTVNIQNSINSTEEFHRPQFFILNFAIGGNWPGFTIDDSRLPARYVIDWVRVYQGSVTPPPPPPPTGAPIGQTIWLRGSNNMYVSGENGAANMMCNRTSFQAWEKFTVVDAGGGKIALRGSNNRYVSGQNGTAPMRCDRTSFQDWEKFDWVGQGTGRVALRSMNKYVSSENGTQAMTCNRTAIGGWEVFTYGTTTPGQFNPNIQENFNKFAASDSKIKATLFPNPSRGDKLSVKLNNFDNASDIVVNVVDLKGKVVLSQVLSSGESDLNLKSKLKRGIYNVQVVNGSKKVAKRLIVQ